MSAPPGSPDLRSELNRLVHVQSVTIARLRERLAGYALTCDETGAVRCRECGARSGEEAALKHASGCVLATDPHGQEDLNLERWR